MSAQSAILMCRWFAGGGHFGRFVDDTWWHCRLFVLRDGLGWVRRLGVLVFGRRQRETKPKGRHALTGDETGGAVDRACSSWGNGAIDNICRRIAAMTWRALGPFLVLLSAASVRFSALVSRTASTKRRTVPHLAECPGESAHRSRHSTKLHIFDVL